jgi:hypothetical protein
VTRVIGTLGGWLLMAAAPVFRWLLHFDIDDD